MTAAVPPQSTGCALAGAQPDATTSTTAQKHGRGSAITGTGNTAWRVGIGPWLLRTWVLMTTTSIPPHHTGREWILYWPCGAGGLVSLLFVCAARVGVWG